MDDLLRMCGAVMAGEHDEIFDQVRKLDEKITALEKVSGLKIDTLIDLFAQGYDLVPAARSNVSMVELASGVG